MDNPKHALIQQLDRYIRADVSIDETTEWVLSLSREERAMVIAHMLNTSADVAEELGLDASAEFFRAIAEYA